MARKNKTLYAVIAANTQEDHSIELRHPIEIQEVRLQDSTVDSIVVAMIYSDETIVDIENVVTDGQFLDHDREKIVISAGQGGNSIKKETLIARDVLRVSLIGDAVDTVLLDIDYVDRADLFQIEDLDRIQDITKVGAERTAGEEFYQVGDRIQVSDVQ